MFFFFKQKTAYEMRISDWSSDVCSSDLAGDLLPTDDSVDEINGIVVGRKGHQYAAIEYFHAALIDEFGFEADGRAIRDDLQIMVGQARKQGPAGPIINIMNLAFRSEESRVGKECVRTGSSGGALDR